MPQGNYYHQKEKKKLLLLRCSIWNIWKANGHPRTRSLPSLNFWAVGKGLQLWPPRTVWYNCQKGLRAYRKGRRKPKGDGIPKAYPKPLFWMWLPPSQVVLSIYFRHLSLQAVGVNAEWHSLWRKKSHWSQKTEVGFNVKYIIFWL